MEEIGNLIFYVCFFLVLLYTLLVVLSPLLIQMDKGVLLGMGAVSYIFNVLMCHQLPQRSLLLFGEHMPLCSRDTGLFFGVVVACFLSFISSKLPSFLKLPHLSAISILLLGVDGVLQFFGVWESTNAVRLATGLAAGFSIAYYAIWVFVGKPKRSRKLAVHAILALLPLLALLLLASFYVGGRYQTKSEVLSKAKAINNSSSITVFYIAPRAFSSSIPSDVYVRDYNDTVLRDVARIGSNSHPYGVWVAVFSNESHGRYVFASEGVNCFYDAMSGELIGKFEHMG